VAGWAPETKGGSWVEEVEGLILASGHTRRRSYFSSLTQPHVAALSFLRRLGVARHFRYTRPSVVATVTVAVVLKQHVFESLHLPRLAVVIVTAIPTLVCEA
jgi:hypothetical protein